MESKNSKNIGSVKDIVQVLPRERTVTPEDDLSRRRRINHEYEQIEKASKDIKPERLKEFLSSRPKRREQP